MLEFDSWQRCETVRHLLNWVLPDPGKILDVGGYPGRLKGMLPHHEWVICDLRVDAPGDQIRGSAIQLPIQDQAFDLSVSLDVLEHIDPKDRPAVLLEMARVSRMGMILTFPTRDPLVEAAEKHVCDTYRRLYEKDHPWLSEHAQYPLPDLDELTGILHSLGGQVAIFDLGDITRWVYLQLADVLMESLPGSLDFAAEVDRFYQEKLYIHDFHAPAYRKIILHMFNMDEPISLSMIETTRAEQAVDEIDLHKTVTQGFLDLILRLRSSIDETPSKTESIPQPEPQKEEQSTTVAAVVPFPPEESKTSESLESKPEIAAEAKEEPLVIPETDIAQETPAIIPEKEIKIELVSPEIEEPIQPPSKPISGETKPAGYDDYVARLEMGLQEWEETYNTTLRDITQLQRWRHNLEQRRSFQMYKRIMRLFGEKIDL